jgi:hypothetical protein
MLTCGQPVTQAPQVSSKLKGPGTWSGQLSELFENRLSVLSMGVQLPVVNA